MLLLSKRIRIAPTGGAEIGALTPEGCAEALVKGHVDGYWYKK